MLKKSFLVAAAVLATACAENPEKDLLKFPVKEVADIPQAVALSPEKAPVELMTPFVFSINVFDGKLLTNADILADHCVDVYDLDSGEELPGLCRKGRGPGEFVDALPYSSSGTLIVAGVGTVSEVSLAEDSYGSILHHVKLQEPKAGFYPIIASAYKVAGGDVLIYNSIQSTPDFVATENPYYATYDWEDGAEKKAFRLFDTAPLANAPETERMFAFDLRDCMDDAGETLCFVMGKMPVFAFLDIASGQTRGFRLKGEPAFSADSQRQFFAAACAQGRFIYALYYGMSYDELDRNGKTTLYKLDWEGNLLNKYELDGIYLNCCASPDKLYLIGVEDDVNVICQLDMENL